MNNKQITHKEFLTKYEQLCEETGWRLTAAIAWKVEDVNLVCQPLLEAEKIPNWKPKTVDVQDLLLLTKVQKATTS